MLKQLDIVQLTDEKKVTYVSGPSGRPACPKGEWSVVGFINDEVVLAKQNTIIKVLVRYVRKIASYDLQDVLSAIDNTSKRPKKD